MDDKAPRNLKAMLSEAKDTSELMVDLGVRRALLRRRAHGGGGARARGAPQRPRARDARDLHPRRPLAARRRADVERAPRRLRRSSGWRNAAVDIARIVTHQPRHPRGARRRPRGGRGGVAPCARAGRLRARAPLARRRGAPGRGGDARRRDPPRQGVDHRPRRRRDARPRRRADPARPAGGHRRAARARRCARVAAARRSTRTRRSPTSTARSTCSSR